MTATLESALWRKGKSPLVREYLATARAAENKAAMLGFLYRPGFLEGQTTDIESALKYKLSDLNYTIVAQMIEREIASTGKAYDVSYREAAIAWELEKATLLTALEQEFADNKKLRELDKEEMDQLKIETDLRQLVILAAKASIEEDMEEYRQEMLQFETEVFPYETALITAKLATANKKLTVIPYIEEVLEKQQDVLDAETDNYDRKNALITAKEDLNTKRLELITAREAIADQIVLLIAAQEELVEKKQSLVDAREDIADQELINVSYLQQYITALTGLDSVRQDLIAAKKALLPKLSEKSTALIAYAAELDAWVSVKQAIAEVKEEIAVVKQAQADQKETNMGYQLDYENAQLSLAQARISLEQAKLTGRSNLMTQQIANASLWVEERETALTERINNEVELFDAESDLDLYRQQQELESYEEIEEYQYPLQRSKLYRIGNARINERGELAAIAANTKITSQLTHLLA